MKSCPKCKGRATKIVHLSSGTIECQQCGHVWPISDKPMKIVTKLPKKGELRDRAILGGEPSL